MMIFTIVAALLIFGCEPETKTKIVEVQVPVPVYPPPVDDPPSLPPPQETFLGFAWFEQGIIDDISRLNSVDAQNAFYLVGCDRWNRGEEMERFQLGVDKGINSLSTERFIERSVKVGSCLYRIDQTDYGFTNDEIELVTDRSLFPVVSETVRGQTIQFLTQREISWAFADDFFTTATEADVLVDFGGDTYRTLVDQAFLDANFFADEGVDVFAEFANEDALAGGTNNSNIAFAGRLIWAIEADNGWMHQTHDVSLAEPDSINQNPFFIEAAVAPGVQVTDKIFNFVAKETLYALPNGMMGVRLSDAAGQALSAAPADVVQDNRGNIGNLPRVVNLGSCTGCHAKWSIGYTDELRDHVLTSNFNEDEKLLALVFFDDAENQDAFSETDEAYARSLSQVGVSPIDPDPINERLILPTRFDYDAEKAASKFFLSTEDYLDCLRGADVARANLGAHLVGGTTTLQVLSQNFAVVIDECNLFQDIEL